VGKRGVVLSAVVTGCAALVALPFFALAPEACSTHNCDFHYHDDFSLPAVDGGPLVFGGRMVDEDTWESRPLQQPWLQFQGNTLWKLHIQELMGREIIGMEADLSVDPSPADYDATGGLSNWAPAAGNLAEFSGLRVDPDGQGSKVPGLVIFVANNTCSDYYLHVLIRAAHVSSDAGAPPPPPPVDAGIDAPDAPLSD
jgi:hypothetical protein